MALTLNDFRQEVKNELLRITSYWIEHSVDKIKGGFYGTVNGKNEPDINAPRSIVVTARILWTFSAMQQLYSDPKYRAMADRAYDYLIKHFIDEEFGGVYWSVTSEGVPLEKKKQLYGHSFAIYGLSEYFKASGNKNALVAAKKIFSHVIKYGYDAKHGGYIEAFERNWENTDDYILCKGDNRKSMNTACVFQPEAKHQFPSAG